MLWYVAGCALIWIAAMFVSPVDALLGARADSLEGAMHLTAPVMLLPALTTWLAAMLVNALSPRRYLDPRVGHRLALLLRGEIAGGLGLGMTAVALAFADRALSDAAIVLLASTATGALVIAATPGVAAGRCIHCDYDLRDLPPHARCPECGAETSALRSSDRSRLPHTLRILRNGPRSMTAAAPARSVPARPSPE